MKIMIGCDHGGLELKERLMPYLRSLDHEIEDIGTDSPEAVDYPYYAAKVAQSVAGGEIDRGILICGTGIGMCMTANRFPGARAALVCEPFGARMSRRHNNSNILCLAGRLLEPGLAVEILEIWLKEPFDGGRHQRRVDLIDQLIQLPTRDNYESEDLESSVQ